MPVPASQRPLSPSPAHIDAIDGLRAFAALAVVSHHCYLHAGRYTWPLGLPHVLGYGYLGVELFFVLSGFCLAYTIFRRGAVDWRTYARHRIRRILPPYWTSFILFAILGLGIRFLAPAALAGSDLLQPASFRELLFGFSLIGVCLNDSYWTLTVEARWYVLLPALLAVHRRLRDAGLFVFCTVAALIFSWIWNHAQLSMSLYLVGPLPLYLPLFAAGIILARRYAEGRTDSLQNPWPARFAFLLSLLAVARFAPNDGVGFSPGRIIAGGALATSLLYVALHDRFFRRLFACRPLRALGQCSYSIYLIHLPLVGLAFHFTRMWNLSQPAEFLLYQIVGVPLIAALGYLFYLAFENPWLPRRETVHTPIVAPAQTPSPKLAALLAA